LSNLTRVFGPFWRSFSGRDSYHVVAVEKPREALEIIQTEVPQVIIAETECGDISDRDLGAIVKATPHLQHIPVILVTASGMPSDYASSHLVAAVVCLANPYKVERMRQAVHLVASLPSQSSKYSSGFNIASFVATS